MTVDISKDIYFGYWRCPTEPMCSLLLSRTMGQASLSSGSEALVHFMGARNVRLVQVNPVHTKRLKDLQGNSPNVQGAYQNMDRATIALLDLNAVVKQIDQNHNEYGYN